MDERFCLAFDGRVADGFAVEQVRTNLASLLHLPENQIARLFAGTAVVVKRNLDKGQAIKYRNMVAKTGALLLIRPQSDLPVEEADSAAVESEPAPVVATRTASIEVVTARPTPAPQMEAATVIAPVESETKVAAAECVADAPAPAVAAPREVSTAEALDCPRCGHNQVPAQQCAACNMDLRLHLQRLARRTGLRAVRR